MALIKKEQIIAETKNVLRRYDVDENDISNVEFIIGRYFHYMTLALLHGVTVIVHRLIKFSLVYTNINDIKRSFRKHIRITKKIYGYHFHIAAEAIKMDKQNYSFRTDKNLLDIIADHVENDRIYKLIRK